MGANHDNGAPRQRIASGEPAGSLLATGPGYSWSLYLDHGAEWAALYVGGHLVRRTGRNWWHAGNGTGERVYLDPADDTLGVALLNRPDDFDVWPEQVDLLGLLPTADDEHTRALALVADAYGINGPEGWKLADEVVARTRAERARTMARRIAAMVRTAPWQRVDLTTIGVAAERPYLLRRTDGAALFYMSKVNSLSGPPESGKSWLALITCAEAAKRGDHSAYIDYEDNPASVAMRLRLLGLTDEEMARVHYYWPDSGLAGALDALGAIGEPLDVVAVDSTTRATLAAGGSTNATDDAAAMGRTLTAISRETGAGVVLLDHVTKDDDPNSPYSRGSGDKLAFIDGAAYKVKVAALFVPGREGRAEIMCVKDRPGGAREAYANGRTAATFVLASDGVGEAVSYALEAGHVATETPTGQFRPTGYMERLSRALEVQQTPMGTRELRGLISGRGQVIDAAIRALVEEGFVAVTPGARGARLHASARPFREHDDHERDRHE